MGESAANARPYSSKEYQRNRAILLADRPQCAAYGCPNMADTADHVVPVDQGGSHELHNLQPLCRGCNSRRGAQYVNAKNGRKVTQKKVATPATTRQRRPRAPKPSDEDPPVFGSPPPDPERPHGASIPQGVTAGNTDSEIIATGLPRLETVRFAPATFGPAVAEWSQRHLGVTLMPWQQHVIDGLLGHDGTGKLAHRQALVSVARQNGKTACMRALVGWIMSEAPKVYGQPQTLISTAHALDLAVQLFYDVAPTLEKLGGESKWSYGRNQLLMPDGSLWLVRAATPSAGHGRSPQWILADEIWDISSEVIDQGLLPSQTAQRSALLAMFSTAGTDASKAMIRWREHGLQLIDSGKPGQLYFAEYSPAPDMDAVNRPELWHLANPALGHTISLETLESLASGPDRAAFLRGNLNLWVSTNEGWLPPGVWEPAVTADRPDGPPTVLATETSNDGTRHVGIAAWAQPDGTVVVGVAFVVGSEHEKWQALADHAGPRTIIAITPNIDIHCPQPLRARKTIVGQAEITKWTGLVRTMLMDGRLKHLGEMMLTEHVNRAVGAQTATGLVLSSMRSPGPIEMARCMVWAAALASKPVNRSKPTVVAARRA